MSVRLNLGAGAHPLEGFVNLDAADGWRFQNGLDEYPDGSVEAVTISHALMYVPLDEWPGVFAEIRRVLEAGGVVRVTEESNDDPASRLWGGKRRNTRTSPERVLEQMAAVGLVAKQVTPGRTRFRDKSLIQQWHGKPPDVFHVEGVKK